jgi:hypothetical protein
MRNEAVVRLLFREFTKEFPRSDKVVAALVKFTSLTSPTGTVNAPELFVKFKKDGYHDEVKWLTGFFGGSTDIPVSGQVRKALKKAQKTGMKDFGVATTLYFYFVDVTDEDDIIIGLRHRGITPPPAGGFSAGGYIPSSAFFGPVETPAPITITMSSTAPMLSSSTAPMLSCSAGSKFPEYIKRSI